MHALIIDDDAGLLARLTRIFSQHDFEVTTFEDLDHARGALQRLLPEVAIVNENLKSADGIELLEELDLSNVMEIYIMSRDRSLHSAVRAMRVGAADYFNIPIDEDRLHQNLKALAAAKTAVPPDEEAADVQKSGRGLLAGESPAMQRLYRLIRKVAPTNATVLAYGESGVGKELVAQTIHQLSDRQHEEFVPVNCGAIPSELMESELFGHVKGAFTGASRNHTGFFERASGGTLFLDEITEMNPALQVKLLRVLESGIVRPVGSEKEIRTNPRIIAATNRDPEEAVEHKQLREDLYYRLAEFSLYVPALRERSQDIELLAQHFLDEKNSGTGTEKRFSAEVLQIFREHHWPGNVRELRNAVARAHILAGDELIADDLPGTVNIGAAGSRDYARMPIGITLEECERRMVLSTLEHFEGNKKEAASVLGVSLKTLYNRLKKYTAD
jgi:DNA-binding NtrC family response regulator